jgi:hypothetical protein
MEVTILADRSQSRVVLHIDRGTTARMPAHIHRFLSNIKRDNKTCGRHLWPKKYYLDMMCVVHRLLYIRKAREITSAFREY